MIITYIFAHTLAHGRCTGTKVANMYDAHALADILHGTDTIQSIGEHGENVGMRVH